MFTSHPLLPRKVLEDALTEEFMRKMCSAVTSKKEKLFCDTLKRIINNQTPEVELSESEVRPDSQTAEDVQVTPSCSQETLDHLEKFIQSLNHKKVGEMTECKKCGVCGTSHDDEIVLASCTHSFCKQCFLSMRSSQDDSTCQCNASIGEWVTCKVNDLHNRCLRPQNKEKVKCGQKSNKKKGRKVDEMDWIVRGAHLVSGAKLRAIISLITKWLKEQPETKVIIYTQFLGMAQVLRQACEAKRWKSASVRGSQFCLLFKS